MKGEGEKWEEGAGERRGAEEEQRQRAQKRAACSWGEVAGNSHPLQQCVQEQWERRGPGAEGGNFHPQWYGEDE